MAIEAAMEAERMHTQALNEQQRVMELDLEQARYEAMLAERRYAACDPQNRLIAAQLEKNWERALRRVEACQSRLDAMGAATRESIAAPDFTGLAEDLEAAWNLHSSSAKRKRYFSLAGTWGSSSNDHSAAIA